ncbi:MAG: hypothetical protein WBA14_01295, partial [Pseudolabrys sp.]
MAVTKASWKNCCASDGLTAALLECWTEENWLSAAKAVKVKIQSGRIDFPREFPYYIGWNKQISNVPGSTIFLPVVDCTRQYINILL